MADFVSKGFASLDFHHDFIQQQCFLPARDGAIRMMCRYLSCFNFLCPDHSDKAIFIIKTIANVFFNNKQRIANDSVLKDTIVGFKKRQRAKHV